MNFLEKLDGAVAKNDSLVCVGLDADLDKLPAEFKKSERPLSEFNKTIIEATHDLVCAYKPNSAFYEALGAEGISQLKETCDYINTTYPHLPIILDAKRGDIGNTNQGYVRFAFEYLGADAITLNPYMGRQAIQPFLDRTDKGCIILCQTSNDGAGEFQGLETSGKKLYQAVAQAVVNDWNSNGNCLLVVGATYPNELKEIRRTTGSDMVFLVPGIGAQGAQVEPMLKAGLNAEGKGLIINSSRGIIYASDPREATQRLRNEINAYR